MIVRDKVFFTKTILILLLIVSLCYSSEPETILTEIPQKYSSIEPLGKIGDFPFPSNPLNDRAKGYLVKGKVKSAVG